MGCGLCTHAKQEAVVVEHEGRAKVVERAARAEIRKQTPEDDPSVMKINDPQFPGGSRVVPRINESPLAASSIAMRRSRSNLDSPSNRGSSKTPPASP
mmetsp:Transcript_27624/g.60778  ORF Transcript_27624/g.60778 Transcript_27624/m.60778 type:complete len:98 (-) Transcript_27624:381-674(-)